MKHNSKITAFILNEPIHKMYIEFNFNTLYIRYAPKVWNIKGVTLEKS